ncbi:Protein OBERON [Quillaja saponaria]|uniref:Protein OBERON n=1 Tax=Quillaja saponaria TaxID=32244 RepID=A0AAD7KNI2_QUISA|nr:Protein OBERON [Quillaja saponaria]
MFGEKDLSNGLASEGDKSQSKLSRHMSTLTRESPDEKMGFSEKGIHFLRESDMLGDNIQSKPFKFGNSGSQELTLSYLCDNSKLGFAERDFPGKILLDSFEKVSYKGKEVIFSENSNQDDKWVERDFLSLGETRGNSSKREVEEENERENRDKKPKLETLKLSLALPDVSLSLTASNALQNGDPPIKPKPSRSVQSLPPSTNNTQTTCSNDFTAASLSYSHSHPFSHNPSCSLTRCSTDNYEYSVGKDDHFWNCGEGTNGSVHSRFKPIGDGVALSNHGGGLYPLLQGNPNHPVNKNSGNSLYKTTSSDNHSFFPSELPARPRVDTQSGDSRGKGSENFRVVEGLDGRKVRKLSERILRETVSESIPVMALTFQELTDETIVSTKEYLKNLISTPEKKDELVSLQHRLDKRSDLTKETLSKCHKEQLEILVAIKTGLESFLSGKVHISITELLEIFLFMRCRNVICKSFLPVDDCECKICSGNKGFCSSCMCPICLNFDCANNTCSWVGCDVCSHWCHAACGIQRNLIKPGPSLKGLAGTTEMQFHCIGCGHASEMFGFVKDVFLCCAKDWGLETLMKELDCVRRIFNGSEDSKGKELHIKADDLVFKLQTKMISTSDACNFIIQFFNYADGMSDFPISGISSKDLVATQPSLRKDAAPLSQSSSLPPKYAYDLSFSRSNCDMLSNDLHKKDQKASLLSELKSRDEFQLGTLLRKDGFESLESIVRIKEAEARMFQDKADEARREADGFQRMIRTNADKLEEEYAAKLTKLSLHEIEERQRKKLEELKVLENSHCDYYKMKNRMQAEITGLLERMDATKQQLVQQAM